MQTALHQYAVHQQNGDVKAEVGMDQQVEKQSQCEDFLSRETLNMVILGVKTQRKIGNGLRSEEFLEN